MFIMCLYFVLQPRYSDATLACEGRLFMVHRLVLATCSDFFDEIFQQTPSDTTRAVIVLNEARAQDVECLLDYMYCGQVSPGTFLFKILDNACSCYGYTVDFSL